MIYVYAIGGGGADAPAGPGIDDRPIEAVRRGSLAAFVSRGVERAPEPGENALLRHESVVDALMSDGPVLPMRFGTVLAGEGDVFAVLAARGIEFERSLAHLRGRVEMRVRALWHSPPPEPTGESGREFLEAKLERHRTAREVAGEVHPCLAELAVASTCRLLPHRGTAFAGAYLVDRNDADPLEHRLEQLAGTRGDVDVVCTGPWPPYTFSEAPDG